MSNGPPQLPPKKPTSGGSPPPSDDGDENEGSYSFSNDPDKKPSSKRKKGDGLFDDELLNEDTEGPDDFDDGLDDKPIGGPSPSSTTGPAIHARDVHTQKPSNAPVIIGGIFVAGLLFVGCLFLLIVMWPRPEPAQIPGGGSNIPINPLGSGPIGSGGFGPKFSFTK